MTFDPKSWKNKEDPTFDPEVDAKLDADELNRIEQGIVDSHSHIADTNNPHAVDKSDVGLSNVTNDEQLKASQLETTLTNDPTKVAASGAVMAYVTGLGYGDMSKAAYDSDLDGKVDAAEAADSVPWSGVTDKPSTFPPESHTHAGVYEPAFSKNTAFNKNFGTGSGEVCQGNDARLSDARAPTSHNNTAHTETYITASGVTYENLNANSDIGTGAGQVAAGDHLHTAVYQPKVLIATCSTAGATAAKTITISGYTLQAGDIFAITFTNGNSVSTATLNVNGVGAKNIRLGATNVSTTTFTLSSGSVALLYYDGTYFYTTGSYRTADSVEDSNMRLSTLQVGATTYQYKLLMEGTDGKYYPLTLEDSTGNTKTVSTVEFKVGGKVIWLSLIHI